MLHPSLLPQGLEGRRWQRHRLDKIQSCVVVPELAISLHAVCKKQDVTEQVELAVVELSFKPVAIYHLLNIFIVLVLARLPM